MSSSDDGQDPVLVNGHTKRSQPPSGDAIGRPSQVELGELLQRRAAQAIEGAKQRNIMRESRRMVDEYCTELIKKCCVKAGWVEEYRQEIEMKRRKAAEEFAKEKAERESLKKSRRRERKPGKGQTDYEEVPGGGQFLMLLLSNQSKSKDGGESDDGEIMGELKPSKGRGRGLNLSQALSAGRLEDQMIHRGKDVCNSGILSPSGDDEINVEALLKEAGIENEFEDGSSEPESLHACSSSGRTRTSLSAKEMSPLPRYVSLTSCRIHHRLLSLFEQREGTSRASAPPRRGKQWEQNSPWEKSTFAAKGKGAKGPKEPGIALRPARKSLPADAASQPLNPLFPTMPGFSMWGSPAASPEVIPSGSPIWGSPSICPSNGSTATAVPLPGSSPIWGSPQADPPRRSGSISSDPWALPESALETKMDRSVSDNWWPEAKAERAPSKQKSASEDWSTWCESKDNPTWSWDRDRNYKSKRRDRDRDRDFDRGGRFSEAQKDLWDCPSTSTRDSLEGLPEFFRDHSAPNFIDGGLEDDALGSTRASHTAEDGEEKDDLASAEYHLMDGIYQ
eukprot:gnl/MRDRNA2_/MRDRNA2_90690_c0_seq1.p1 gnl/MRDRNA2_/MRDRNA2_90690_c0~~gnl/MRDRNA2_/MRDRNA2_90690_c0_seq1.p1  ORF type:complete len:578 (+),score=124.84 gnl/MRDRNA2_/MRDRNA2_90690_c0_seq1:45-1736(+)